MSYLQKCHCYISSSARCSTHRRSRRRSSTSVSTRRADEPRPSCSPTRLYPHGVVLVFALPFPSSHSHQAELELSAPSASTPAILAAVPRFAAPRAAQPRPLPPPPVPELVRANPGPNRPPERLRHRPPLPRRAGAPPLRRSPSSGLPPPDSSRGELGRDLLHLPDPFPGRIPSPRRRSAAAPPWPRRPPLRARRGATLRQPLRHHRAPHRRLAFLMLAPPRFSAAWPCRGRNAAADAAPSLLPRAPPPRVRPCTLPARAPHSGRPGLGSAEPRRRQAAAGGSQGRRGPPAPGRAPAGRPPVRAKQRKGGAGLGSLACGARLSAAPPPFIVFHFLILAETLKIHVNL